MSVRSVSAGIAAFTLAACQPSPTDDARTRAPDIPQRDAPSAPIAAPDVTGAAWVPSVDPARLLYGRSGEVPLLALACVTEGGTKRLRITRYERADAGAGAIMAIIGKQNRARLPVEAVWNGRGWLWEASYPAVSRDMDVFGETQLIELTVPGAGRLDLNPSELPAALLEACRPSEPPPPA